MLQRRVCNLLLALALATSLGACATRPPDSDPEALAEFRANNDPLEPLNRGVFFVNQALDTMFIAPISEFYRYLIPWPIRQVVRNGLANLREPVTLANDVLQGNMGRAGDTASRFLLNSTVGLAGAFDVATDFGHPRAREGFEDTFAVWGVGEGPFLILPILGPSNVRDTVGYVADWFADPWPYLVSGNTRDLVAGRTVLEFIDLRENLLEVVEEINRTSLDPYATVRSGYRQRRQAEINNTVQPFSAKPVTRIENR
jgi:phospholipid-binding lipoprotein MlaA